MKIIIELTLTSGGGILVLEDKFSRVGIRIILVLIIIYLLGQIPYFMNPLSNVLTIVFFPILLGGFFYYLLRPAVRKLTAKINNKNLAILITLLGLIVLIVLIIYFGGSIIYTEVKKLINFFTVNYEVNQESINQVITWDGNFEFLTKFNLQERIISFGQGILSKISKYNFTGAFSSLTNLGTVLVLIPFVLIYFLKDDYKIYRQILRLTPAEKEELVNRILVDVDRVLSTYLSSQLVVAFILGILMFIGYLIIGLPNALALALIGMITSLIPILGPIIGVLPAVFIALTTDLWMILKLAIVVAVTQQLEGNLVRPIVQGEQLQIHPLIVIFLIIVSVMLYGVLGALFAVPTYAVLRVVIKDLKFAQTNE